MPEAKDVLQGSVWRILAVVGANGKCPFLEFFNDQLTARQRNDFWALLKHFADRAWLTNKQKFKSVEGTEFFEFKDFQVRVLCFTRPGHEMVLTHGLIKKQDRLSSQDIERARRLKAEFERKSLA